MDRRDFLTLGTGGLAALTGCAISLPPMLESGNMVHYMSSNPDGLRHYVTIPGMLVSKSYFEEQLPRRFQEAGIAVSGSISRNGALYSGDGVRLVMNAFDSNDLDRIPDTVTGSTLYTRDLGTLIELEKAINDIATDHKN